MLTNNSPSVPSLKTALTGPLLPLEKIFLQNHVLIESWFRNQFRQTPPPFYCSVDIRNEGFKIAPVDTNLFPAGFNNLNPDFMPLLIQAASNVLNQFFPCCQRLLLIPENHTRNPFYWQSLAVLYEVLQHAGYEVRVASWLNLDQHITLSTGEKIPVELFERKENLLCLPNYMPCAILLNNDLSGEIPDILKNIEQPYIPSIQLGWHYRLKSHHFSLYEKVAKEFCALFNLDPWLVTPLFETADNIDFMQGQDNDRLKMATQTLLTEIEKKYSSYHLPNKPFAIIKADSGTYGMGIMTALSADDVENLNRKQRTKMSSSKSGQAVSRVIIQEGVYTEETFGADNAVAEPVVYMIGSQVVGGFYRVHKERGKDENLNAPGMQFEPLAFATACNQPNPNLAPIDSPNRFYAYGVIARLALLAASKEIQEVTL